jgi:amino acid adenylation domain-containing protein
MADWTLYRAFLAGVADCPDRVALEVDRHALTYARLHAAVESVAAQMVSVAGRVPSTVALLASRTVATYVAYLAVQRLGAVVVPLGAEGPVARNAMICRRAGVDLVVFDSAIRTGDPTATATARPAMRLDDIDAAVPGAALPPYAASRDDVAYTLFTSGSTGEPKGVPIRHRNLDQFIHANVERYEVGAGCRLSQTFDLTFDPSVFDMFVTWQAGATLVVPQKRDLMSPTGFVNEHGITHWSSVPWFITLAERDGLLVDGAMPDLAWSVFCGEPLRLDQAAAWARAAPASTIENAYGPTELTVYCAAYRLPRNPAAWPVTVNGTVPIGEVYPHLDGALVGDDGRLADDGELCVRGEQRFAGYLFEADNDDRFYTIVEGVAVSGNHTCGWYRTGDLVQRDADGMLVHLGRRDSQVKIRGQRVEPAEVETLMRRVPGIREAVVVLVGDGRDATVLLAAYTGTRLGHAAIVAALNPQLPAHLVPARSRWLPALPRLPSGKIDRRRLARDLGGGVG